MLTPNVFSFALLTALTLLGIYTSWGWTPFLRLWVGVRLVLMLGGVLVLAVFASRRDNWEDRETLRKDACTVSRWSDEEILSDLVELRDDLFGNLMGE